MKRTVFVLSMDDARTAIANHHVKQLRADAFHMVMNGIHIQPVKDIESAAGLSAKMREAKIGQDIARAEVEDVEVVAIHDKTLRQMHIVFDIEDMNEVERQLWEADRALVRARAKCAQKVANEGPDDDITLLDKFRILNWTRWEQYQVAFLGMIKDLEYVFIKRRCRSFVIVKTTETGKLQYFSDGQFTDEIKASYETARGAALAWRQHSPPIPKEIVIRNDTRKILLRDNDRQEIISYRVDGTDTPCSYGIAREGGGLFEFLQKDLTWLPSSRDETQDCHELGERFKRYLIKYVAERDCPETEGKERP